MLIYNFDYLLSFGFLCYSLILGERYEGFGGNKRDPEVNFGTQQVPEARFHKLQLIKDAGLARSLALERYRWRLGARFGNWYLFLTTTF